MKHGSEAFYHDLIEQERLLDSPEIDGGSHSHMAFTGSTSFSNPQNTVDGSCERDTRTSVAYLHYYCNSSPFEHKNVGADSNKQAVTDHKLHITPKPPAAVHTGSASSDRPYACPYEGCGKAYIHEYKLNLHLRKEHPEHNCQENGKIAIAPSTDHDMDEASDHDVHAKKAGGSGKNSKRSKSNPMQQLPPTKPVERKAPTTLVPANILAAKIQWVPKSPLQEDSEETEEDRDDAENDDEETEDED
ncbi:hypothetical protein KSP40_PGU019034 [Platanthera guangdongensis]|uniref:C2H2-type domain-containing protein n=1 Tax=Platanthera guangdongensis TaxID=2320717 RepID=A0ABR2MR87_9ASPA